MGHYSIVALRMYKTVLLPQILYASVVWWCVVSRVEAKNLQQSLQDSLPEGSYRVCENNTYRGTGSSPLFNSPGLGCYWSS